MRSQLLKFIAIAAWMAVGCACVLAQDAYRVVAVENGGTITGTVKWTGPAAQKLVVPINKDVDVCDPEGKKTRDLERLVVGPNGGVANTVVYLKDVASGKEFTLPAERRMLNQRLCRYEPHILLVPESEALSIKSSDHVLHTVHSEGAASFNLAFPFADRVSTQKVGKAGLINLKCNGGHSWMNAEAVVVPHPYYAVTGEDGQFEIANVPPGEYSIVAWHEGWTVRGRENALDVLSQKQVQRLVFSDPKTWEQRVTVAPGSKNNVKFAISQK